jgi:F-type H+-transporting ATPase subunit gamma
MPNLHDIERRINSVASTKQITRTMEMVAAAKIHRASQRMERALPWSNALSDMLVSTAKYAAVDSEPLLKPHDVVNKVALVVLTSDRGLAGGFNSNVLRCAEKLMKDKQREGIEVEIIACGKKAIGYFEYRKIMPVLEFRDLSADPTYEQATDIAQYLADSYRSGVIDEALIVFNHAKNSAEQRLVTEQVLPVPEDRFAELIGYKQEEADIYYDFREHIDDSYMGDIDFEPDGDTVMSHLMWLYLRNMLYFTLIDSAAAEQGARRTAMKSATDNANEMVETLTRVYNRERQGAITTEINEIVGGAAALED